MSASRSFSVYVRKTFTPWTICRSAAQECEADMQVELAELMGAEIYLYGMIAGNRTDRAHAVQGGRPQRRQGPSGIRLRQTASV